MARISSPCCPLTSTRVPHAAHTCMCRNTPTYALNKCKWITLPVLFLPCQKPGDRDLWFPLPQLSHHPSLFVLCRYAEERGCSGVWHNSLSSAAEINEAIYYLWQVCCIQNLSVKVSWLIFLNFSFTLWITIVVQRRLRSWRCPPALLLFPRGCPSFVLQASKLSCLQLCHFH